MAHRTTETESSRGQPEEAVGRRQVSSRPDNCEQAQELRMEGEQGNIGQLEEHEEANDELTSLPTDNGPPGDHQQSLTLSAQVVTGAKEASEEPTSGRTGGCSNQLVGGVQFSRLDPNRRSFSTPSVNLAVSSPPRVVGVAGRGSGRDERRPAASSATQTAADKKSRSGGSTSGQKQQRRRTALGLISFGSAHFRLGATPSSGNCTSAMPASNSSGAGQQQQVASKKASAWRHWFTGGKSVSGGGSTSAAARGGEWSDAASSKPSGARKFLLQSLKPTGSYCSSDCSSKSTEVASANTNPRVEPIVARQDKERKSEKEKKKLKVENDEAEQQEPDTRAEESKKCVEGITTIVDFEPKSSTLSSGTKIDENSIDEGTKLESVDIKEDTKTSKETSPFASSIESTNVTKFASAERQHKTTVDNKQELSQNEHPPTAELAWDGLNANSNSEWCVSGAPIGLSISAQLTTSELEKAGTEKLRTTSSSTDNAGLIMGCLDMRPEQASGGQFEHLSLVDRLIDSELEWRQLIREANGGDSALSQLSELQIKRQEVIHELVQTERHHCLTLALMRQVYLAGLRRLNESRSGPRSDGSLLIQQQALAAQKSPQALPPTSASSSKLAALSTAECPNVGSSPDLIDLERLFPALEDLIGAHELFFAHLRLRLVESCQQRSTDSNEPAKIAGLVGPLGDLLCEQFRWQPAAGSRVSQAGCKEATNKQPSGAGPSNGQKLLQAYAKFCGQHYDSSRYYKQLMQHDKGFKQFIELCKKQNAACRQRGIPECNLLVTQRLTKYPLLIEQLIKTSKDEAHDEERKLREALQECKSLLAELNCQLARKESFERLLDIYAQFCPKSYTIYNKHLRFTKHDLLQHKRLRQLLHSDGQVRIWSATRRKLFQVLCLILNDIVVFLRIESSTSSTSSVAASVQPTPPLVSSAALPVVASTVGGQSGAIYLPEPAEPAHHLYSLADYQHQQQQGALISALAHAGLHSPGGHATAAGANNSGLIHPQAGTPGASGHANGSGAPGANLSGLSVKYYFANIDNKSSVISLSKLLIREKAAHDGEPRIYLISSSPRQPEMYELAFISKRHQMGFVDKLKGCIEQHNKLLEQERRSKQRSEIPFGDDFLDYDDEDFEELEVLHGGHLSDDEDDEEVEDDDDEEDDDIDDDEEDEDACSGELEDDDYNDEREEDEAGNDRRRKEENGHHHENKGEEVGQVREKGDGAASCYGRVGGTRVLVAPPLGDQCTQGEKSSDFLYSQRADSAGNSPAFDIEHNVMLPPPDSEEATEEEPTSDCDKLKESLSFDEPSKVANQSEPLDDKSHPNQHRHHHHQMEPGKMGDATGGPVVNKHTSGESGAGSSAINTSSEPDEVTADEASSQLGSNESGLSERAKDSLDEALASPCRQKLRGARRRRAQRPRQVSNQSSSSSEAAHRQAIQLVAGSANVSSVSGGPVSATNTNASGTAGEYEEEFDSGRGHDDSSSAASTSSNSLGHSRTSGGSSSARLRAGCDTTSSASTQSPTQQRHEISQQLQQHQTQQQSQSCSTKKEGSKLLDLKLLRSSISLSTSSITSTLMGSLTNLGTANQVQPSATEPKPAGASNGGHISALKDSSPSSAPSSTGGQSGPAQQVVSSSGARCFGSGSSTKQAASGSLSKGSVMKQRKLSTVSTMSSQLKLLNKLKNGYCCNGATDGHICAGSSKRNGATNQSFSSVCEKSNNSGLSGMATVGTCCACTSSSASSLSKQVRQQMRRSSFIPEQKLEELRDLRIQLDKDKQEWQAKFDSMQEQLLNERRELDLARERLKQDRQQVANEREQLYRKLDVLKEKGILLSPSHKVIITTPELRIFPPHTDVMKQPQQQSNQVVGCAQGSQRQALQQISGNLSSSIRIQQYPTHRQQQQQHQSVSTALNYYTHPVNTAADFQVHPQTRQMGAATNLSIHTSATACKVPLHLSEQGSGGGGGSPASRPNSLLGSLGKSGSQLCASLLSDRLGTSGTNASSLYGKLSGSNLESHLI